MRDVLVIRTEHLSRLLSRRAHATVGILLLLLCLVTVWSLISGKYTLSVSQIWQAWTTPDHPANTFILTWLRLPRLVLAIMAGASLALAGLLLQTLVRNPLASPDIVGVTGGASVATVACLSFWSGTVSVQWLPLVSMAGGFLAAGIVYGVTWRTGLSPTRLILVGIGVAAICGALTSTLLVFSPIASTLNAYVWLTGSVYAARWHEIATLACWLVPALIILACNVRCLPLFELDAGLMASLGLHWQRRRIFLLGLSIYLATIAVAYTGALGFVGLLAPHIARKLVNRPGAARLWAAAATGAILVALADLVARTLFLPMDLPAGIFVSGIGAPYFLYLLLTARSYGPRN